MKKKRLVAIGAAVIVIAALTGAAATPYWFGVQAEQRYQEALQRLAPQSGITITPVDYERGWLTSTASMRVALTGTPFTLFVQHRIVHGPLPFARWLQGSFDLTPIRAIVESTAIVQTAASGVHLPPLPPLHAVTTLDLNGHLRARYGMPAVHLPLANGIKVDFAGFDGITVFNDDLQGGDTQLTAPSLAVAGPLGGVEIHGLSFDADTHKGPAGYPVGQSTFAIDRIAVPAMKTVVQGLRFSSNARMQGPGIAMVFRDTVHSAQVRGANYGPLQVAFELRNLDPALIMKLARLGDDVSKQKLPPQQAGMMVAGQALKLVAALAKKAPELDLTQASLQLPGGVITAHGKLILDGSQGDLAQNPFAFLTALKGDAVASVPAPVIEGVVRTRLRQEVEAYRTNGALTADEAARLTEQKVNVIVDQALPGRLQQVLQRYPLIRNGANYEIKAVLEGGQLQVNGRPWAPTRAPTPSP